MNNLQQRLAVSFILISMNALVIYYSDDPGLRWLLGLFIAATVAVSCWEYYKIASMKGFHPLQTVGIATGAAYIIALFGSTVGVFPAFSPVFVLAVGMFSCFLYYCRRGSDPVVNIALTAFGVIYLALTLGTIININYFFPDRTVEDGRWWVFYMLAVTKMSDTGAFFIGKNFGKTPLAPILSPKKTYEGAIGGLLAALATSLLFCWAGSGENSLMKFHLSVAHAILLGILVNIVAQFGDLAESLLKRDTGVKHSSQLPGLGGMLDVVDSLIFTAPLVYFFLCFRGVV